MDIGAINKGAKGKKGHKEKGKGKKGYKDKTGSKGKGYGQQGRGKGYMGQPATPFKGYYPGNKGKGQGKATGSGKGKAPTTGCYRCGQPGHIARDCKVSIHNLQEVDSHDDQQDTTSQRYNQTTYDNHWWTNNQTQVNAVQPQQQLALPAPSQLDAQPALQIAAVTAQGSKFTHHTDTRRSTMGDTPARPLDIQQSRIPCETPHSQAQSNIHARPTVSSSNGQPGRLQKNNGTQTRWNNRGL